MEKHQDEIEENIPSFLEKYEALGYTLLTSGNIQENEITLRLEKETNEYIQIRAKRETSIIDVIHSDITSTKKYKTDVKTEWTFSVKVVAKNEKEEILKDIHALSVNPSVN